jgi:hypothetical protein
LYLWKEVLASLNKETQMDIQSIPYSIPPAQPAYMDANLVLWLAFYSANTRDYSRFGNNGSLNGPLWAKDRFGAVLSFDGVDDYVNVEHSDSLDLNTEITIELWFNIHKYYILSSQGIISKYEYNKAGFIFGVDANNGNRLNFTLTGSDGPLVISRTILSDYILPLNKWLYVAVLKDNQDEMRMYINGIPQSETRRFSYSYSIIRPLSVGKYMNMHFDGLISEVRIYNRALTANEIRRRFRGEI